jgi:hypothetical protein
MKKGKTFLIRRLILDDVKRKALSLKGRILKTVQRGAAFYVDVGPSGLI